MSLFVDREDFSGEVTLDSLARSMISSGFQATNVGLAIEEINRMVWNPLMTIFVNSFCFFALVVWKIARKDLDSTLPVEEDGPKTNCTIFLAYTSNMISSGMRETIRFLVQHKLVTITRNLFTRVRTLTINFIVYCGTNF